MFRYITPPSNLRDRVVTWTEPGKNVKISSRRMAEGDSGELSALNGDRFNFFIFFSLSNDFNIL